MSARGSNPAPGYGTCSRVRCVRRKPKGWNNGGGTATPRGCWSRESGHAPNCQGKDTCVHGAASAGRHRADRSRLGRKLAVELILSFPWKWLACRPFYDRHRYFPEVWARGLNGRWHFGWIPYTDNAVPSKLGACGVAALVGRVHNWNRLWRRTTGTKRAKLLPEATHHGCG